MIQIQNLSKAYEGKQVLNVPELNLNAGEVIGLVGNNGAGKTTLISLILDLIKANSGEVSSNGIKVSGSEKWKAHTGSFISDSFLIDFLTPEEYFDFVASVNGWNAIVLSTFLSEFDDFFGGEVLGQKKYIRSLSKGNQKKVGIIAALIGDPKVVLLDEPFANLDPSTQNKLKNIIQSSIREDCTIMVSSHNINHISQVCNRIIVLEKGLVVKDLQNNADSLRELELHFQV